MSTSSKAKNAKGSEVISLDSLAQQKRDALPEACTFELRGVEFTLQPFNSLPMNLQERMAGPEDYLSILRTALSDEKVQEMIDAGYTLVELEVIANEWMKRSGVEPGESAASSGS